MTTATPSPAHVAGGGDRTTDRLYRSRTDRRLAGICGGIAERYVADPTLVRLLAVILGLATGLVPALVLYLVAAIVIPEGPGGDAEPARPTRAPDAGRGVVIVGLVLVALGFMALANEVLRIEWSLLWPVAMVAIGGLVIATAPRR